MPDKKVRPEPPRRGHGDTSLKKGLSKKSIFSTGHLSGVIGGARDVDSWKNLADCDQDGLPDACQIESGEAQDCNGNGIPDSCDLQNGAEDGDQDGIPDACQIASSLRRPAS